MNTHAVSKAPSSIFVADAESSLTAEDPRRSLAREVRAGRVAQPGSEAAGFFACIHEACPELSLRDLPPELAQAILELRAKTMDEFFKSWSECIAKNAEEGKKAALRRQIAATLERAHNLGHVSDDLYGATRHDAGLADVEAAHATARHATLADPAPSPTAPKVSAPQSSQSVRLRDR
jgi:hypothetical protein